MLATVKSEKDEKSLDTLPVLKPFFLNKPFKRFSIWKNVPFRFSKNVPLPLLYWNYCKYEQTRLNVPFLFRFYGLNGLNRLNVKPFKPFKRKTNGLNRLNVLKC